MIRHHPSSLSTGIDCCFLFFWRSQILFKVCACKIPPFFTTLTVSRSDLSLLVDLRVRFATLCTFFFFETDFSSCAVLRVALAFSCASRGIQTLNLVLTSVASGISAVPSCSSSCSTSLTSRDTADVDAPEANNSSPASYSR